MIEEVEVAGATIKLPKPIERKPTEREVAQWICSCNEDGSIIKLLPLNPLHEINVYDCEVVHHGRPSRLLYDENWIDGNW